MSLAHDPLPSDPEVLRVFAAGLQAELARKDMEIAANAAEIYAKTLHIEKLRMQLAVLRRARFGRSSEKLDGDIEQLELLIGELEEETAQDQARTEAAAPAGHRQARARRQPVRRPLPEHLPREVVTHDPPCTCPGCGGTVFSRVGQDERLAPASRVLPPGDRFAMVPEYVPSSFKVIRHVRPKLSCRACKGIVQEPMPALPIKRGRPGPGLIAHTLVSKYCDHLPLHRQSVIYAREGVELDRSTLADWVGQAVFLLSPLAEEIGSHVLAGAVLHADDTTVPVLAPGLGRTRTGRLWVAVRDERGWGSTAPPAALYRYSADRKGVHAAALLGTCRGFLHADGYAGFDQLYKPKTPGGDPPLVEVACWSHARRKFYDVHHATAAPIALDALQRIAALFAIEASIQGRAPERRAAARREHAQPLLDQLRASLDASLARVSGKSTLAGAIRYTLTRWTALSRYVADGRLEMSNNAAERAMRPPGLGRKNYLFAGADAGGQRAACIYTIVETAKMNGVNPHAYLANVLGRIAEHPRRQLSALLPWNWTP
jgi:transposase